MGRLILLSGLILVLAVLGLQMISLFGGQGRALAPVVGQYYVGAPWMVAPTPSPTSPPTPTPFDTPTPTPTVAQTRPASMNLTGSPTGDAAQTRQQAASLALSTTPSPAPLPTPDTYLVEVVMAHGIDPAGSYIVVNQNAQRMTVVQDGRVARTMAISTGDPDQGWYTPGWSGQVGEYWGTFQANGVYADDAWYLFQAGGSILIHSLPYTVDELGGKRYQGMNELGVFPASRGCIRLSPEEARWFSAWGPQEIPIVILPWDGGTGREG